MIENLSMTWLGVQFDLALKGHRLTLIAGASGISRTDLFRALAGYVVLRRDEGKDGRLLDLCSDTKYIDSVIACEDKALVVIDNADLILNGVQKRRIAMDVKKQYILFSRDIQGFQVTPQEYAELVVVENEGKLVYPLI